ncbi:hypothetical protein ACIP2X_06590 [Streptomyces sp. NPDC089424]|uniref:hypothetical protein n=1 Tax=Streptomyces sp. NPDC089424 TaxID=3365917 RepID=UPI003809BBEE
MEGELRRLRFGPTTEDGRQRPFLVEVRFTADEPGQVIADARAVLTRVVERTGDWPDRERWPRLLPAWFIQRCAPEPFRPEPGERVGAGAWLRRWRAMLPLQTADDEGPWTLSAWLHDFDPEGAGADRSWWWWHAGTDESGVGWIQVATTGCPFGSGSLYWLIEASGGRDLAYGGP